MELWFNRIFVFSLIVFWLSIIAYVIWQRYRIKKRSEGLEFEAGLGRSSSQLFHDISGLIGTISGTMYLIRDDIRNDELDPKEIEKLGEFLDFLVQYTKNFKSLVGSFYKGGDEPIELVKTLKLLIDTQARACFKKLGIQITEDYRVEDCRVPAKMIEALFNIIRNACESMTDSSEKKLSITVDKKDNLISIDILDTGCGISEKMMSRIFEYGFTTKSDGTGQGMSIAKKAVEDYNGSMELQSAVGKGTTVGITLPIDMDMTSEKRIE